MEYWIVLVRTGDGRAWAALDSGAGTTAPPHLPCVLRYRRVGYAARVDGELCRVGTRKNRQRRTRLCARRPQLRSSNNAGSLTAGAA